MRFVLVFILVFVFFDEDEDEDEEDPDEDMVEDRTPPPGGVLVRALVGTLR